MSKNKKELIIIKDKLTEIINRNNELIEKHNKLNNHFNLLLDCLELEVITEKYGIVLKGEYYIKYTDKIVKKKKK